MLTCFNVQKTHYFSNTVHYCSSSMPCLSQMHYFLQSSFQQVQSALIGQLTQSIVIGRTPQARVGNVTPLTIIASFSFQVSFIRSSPKGEQSRVTDTVMILVCICSTQAAVKTISDGLYTPLWCDPVPLTHTHSHNHTHNVLRAKLHIWTVNSKYLI